MINNYLLSKTKNNPKRSTRKISKYLGRKK